MSNFFSVGQERTQHSAAFGRNQRQNLNTETTRLYGDHRACGGVPLCDLECFLCVLCVGIFSSPRAKKIGVCVIER